MKERKVTIQVLDFTSGSGGKTLAFAFQMGNKGSFILFLSSLSHNIRTRLFVNHNSSDSETALGSIYLHDIPPLIATAKKRCARAGIFQTNFFEEVVMIVIGITNAQFVELVVGPDDVGLLFFFFIFCLFCLWLILFRTKTTSSPQKTSIL
jgi:hypothetical protein